MGRRKGLTEKEKGSIDSFAEMKLSHRNIARRTGRSRKCISNYLKDKEKYGKRYKGGQNHHLTPAQKENLLAFVKGGNYNCTQVCKELNLPVTARRVSQLLNASGRFKWKKLMKKPALEQRHMEARLEFAKNYVDFGRSWEKVIFSDEKKFNLDGPDGFKYYWACIDNTEITMSRNFGGGTVMVWAAFSKHGRTPVCFISTRMCSQKYTELLEEVLIEFGESLPDSDFIYQQDNAAIHTSRLTKAWLAEKEIELLPWPARSPDLNPIENLWGILANAVYANGRQYANVQELKAAITAEWRNISPDILQRLVNSMKNRLIEVIQNNGGHTHY
ncbi:Tc1-like transposase, DDE domain [Sergentomyia squamirostris]